MKFILCTCGTKIYEPKVKSTRRESKRSQLMDAMAMHMKSKWHVIAKEARMFRAQGLNYREVARQLSVGGLSITAQTVHRMLRKEGL